MHTATRLMIQGLITLPPLSACLEDDYIEQITVTVTDINNNVIAGAEVVLDNTCCTSTTAKPPCRELTTELGEAKFSISGYEDSCAVTVTAAGFRGETQSFATETDFVRVEVILDPL